MEIKKVVFILEDDPSISELIGIILSVNGYEVVSCATIGMFNETLAHCSPNMFVLDILLPDGNGLDICNQLRLDILTSSVPILIMSATASKSEIDGFGAYVDFISKPFDVQDFLNRVKRAA